MIRLIILLLSLLSASLATAQQTAVDSLYRQARHLFDANDLRGALSLFLAVDSMQQTAPQPNDGHRYSTGTWVVACYGRLGDFAHADSYNRRVMERCKAELGTDSDGYLHLLTEQENILYELGKLQEAISTCREELAIRERMRGRQDSAYIYALNRLGVFVTRTGNHAEAVTIFSDVVQLCRQTNALQSKTGLQYLDNLAHLCQETGRWREATQALEESLSIIAVLKGRDNDDYVNCLLKLTRPYSQLGLRQKNIANRQEAADIILRIHGEKYPYYAQLLSALCHEYYNIGRNTDAVACGQRAVDLLAATTDTLNYAIALDNLGKAYSDLNNTEEAVRMGRLSVSLLETNVAKYAKTLSVSLYNLASNLLNVEPHETLAIAERLLGLRRQLYGERSVEYGNALDLLSSAYYKNHRYTEAVSTSEQAIDLIKSTSGTQSPRYFQAVKTLADIYYNIGDSLSYRKATDLAMSCLPFIKDYFGEGSMTYTDYLFELAVYAFSASDYRHSAEWLASFIGSKNRLLLSSFTEMSATERRKLWKPMEFFYNDILHEMVFAITYFDTPYPPLIEAGMDALLLSKGLLLNTDVEAEQLIRLSGDTTLLNRYAMLQQLRSERTDRRRQGMATDSLDYTVNRMERDLLRDAKAYGDFTHNMQITWRDVQAQLNDDDIAVEFVRIPFPNWNYDDKRSDYLYAAYTVRKGYDTPHLVSSVLFEKDVLLPWAGRYYNSGILYSMIWQNLESRHELDGVKNIYFSPAGELNRIAIESVPQTEKYNFFRLTSTRELATNRPRHTTTKAVLYGGLDYAEGGTLPTSGTRGSIRGVAQLPATKVEVDSIRDVLAGSHISTILLDGTKGTESSLRQLSGDNCSILHIATHGFYEKPDSTRQVTFGNWIKPGSMSGVDDEEKALMRSGLLMSGASASFFGDNVRDAADNGVVTAAEIGQLNLRGLDLVTLSACETALGDVSGEGVFGLQRGFKKAGAQSILMSLWKVDDEATCLLMTAFYRNWMVEKRTKREALEAAKQAVRQHKEKGWDNPKYWAAFILLDALD